MNILILGGSGFIGNAVFLSLVAKHNITIAGRKKIDGYEQWKYVDFTKKNDWEDLLCGIDLVINAIGIIEGDFDQIQRKSPLELYGVCVKKKIKVIHISAIGAEKKAPATAFLKTKKVTDEFLLQYDQARVVYPGVVIGQKGRSARFFAEIARFPLIPLFSEKPVYFVHIDQLVSLIQDIVSHFDQYPGQIFAVAKPESLKTVFSAMKGHKAHFIKVPEWIFSSLFTFFPNASIGIFNKATFNLFLDSSADDYKPMFDEISKRTDLQNIVGGEVFPPLFALLAISFIWIASGVTSLISWDASYALMQEVGASHDMAIASIWAGSLVDIFLGIAVFIKKYRKQILVLQILTMLIYMAILTLGAPHYWLHPFGVLTKNIPLIALSYYLYWK